MNKQQTIEELAKRLWASQNSIDWVYGHKDDKKPYIDYATIAVEYLKLELK